MNAGFEGIVGVGTRIGVGGGLDTGGSPLEEAGFMIGPLGSVTGVDGDRSIIAACSALRSASGLAARSVRALALAGAVALAAGRGPLPSSLCCGRIPGAYFRVSGTDAAFGSLAGSPTGSCHFTISASTSARGRAKSAREDAMTSGAWSIAGFLTGASVVAEKGADPTPRIINLR